MDMYQKRKIRKEKNFNDNERNLSSTNINWFPGHMQKTKRQIKELSPLIDFVIELVDARIPLSSQVEGIEELVKNKPKIIIMTKKDLADDMETEKWIRIFKEKNEEVLAISLKNDYDYKEILKSIDKIQLSINQKRVSKGLKAKELRGLVIGIPNVGKSTLINKLAKRKVAGVGNIPGFTKSLNWFKTSNALLLDSPGLLWPKFANNEIALNLSSMSAIRTEILPIDEIGVHILQKLNTYYPEMLKNRYGIEKLSDDYLYNYELISKKLGIAKQNGEVDFNKVNLFLINDIKNENIKGITFDRSNL